MKDGTALYEAVAPIFIAQMNDRNLTFAEYVIIRSVELFLLLMEIYLYILSCLFCS